MLERFEEIADQSHHTANLTRGPMVIYIDCTHCSFSTVWQPNETTRQVAGRWNNAHKRRN